MQLSLVQRWEERRDRYRPAGERIAPADYDVAAMPGDAQAKMFIQTHHYSRSYPAARFRFGLHRRGALVGVAVFSVPMSAAVLAGIGTPQDGVELGRFVLLDEVPGNGETWFLARCFESLRRAGIRGVVSFSDDMPRENASGGLIFPGHIGTIYQAHNAAYRGRGTARTLALLPDGTVFSARAMQKIRAGERGWRGCAATLESLGAEPCPDDARREWLRRWLPQLTRPLAHPGNHKYAWRLDRTRLESTTPYPKRPA
jgi:hypothetical protein